MDLKFFYVVELNLQHQAISKLTIAKEFASLSWLSLTSEPFIDDAKCIESCKKFMKAKAKVFNQEQKVKFSYAENPILTCAEKDMDKLETDFDENALVTMTLKDIDGDWLMKAAVMVYGLDLPTTDARLH